MSKSFSKRILSGASVFALAAVGLGAATAAEALADTNASSDETETIIVVGQQRLSRDPEVAKKSSMAILDSVGALEIQQQTDVTVADVVSRMVGVTAQRGYQTQKAWYASIRGLDGNYNSVDLDGGMFIDSTRNDRAAYLDTVPAVAINELVVTKTVTPDMDPNSIGGHLSMLTLRSFDLNGETLVKGDATSDIFTQNGSRTGHMPGLSGNVLIKQTFGTTQDYGFVLAVSGHDDYSNEIYNNAATYSVVNDVDLPSGSQQHGNFDVHDHGLSVLGKIEARSGDRFYAFAAVNFFKEDIDQNNYRGGLSLTTSSISDATETSGDFTSGVAQAYTRQYDINRQVVTLTTGADYQVTDASKLSAVASFGHSDHNETLWNGAMFQYSGVSGHYDLTKNGIDFQLDDNSGLGAAANWKVTPSSAATITYLPMTDDVYTFKIDYDDNNFSFSRGFGAATGFNFRRLHRVFNQSADSYTLPTGTVYTLNEALDDGATSHFNGTGTVYVDAEKYWQYMKDNGTKTHSTTPTSSFDLYEDVYGGYVAAYYATERLKALVGGRYEQTDENDQTAKLQGSTTVGYAFTRNYAYLLPNAQASYDVFDGFRLRAAYTETIARPTFTTFAQGLTINNYSSTTPFVRGSNSQLKARLSDNYDLSLEYYADEGYVSVGLFEKQIHHEVYYLTTTATNAATGVTTQTYTPENAGKSSVSGLELAAEWHDFAPLAAWLEGVSLRGNLSLFDGCLGVVNSDGSKRNIGGLNQQPAYMTNLVAAYEQPQYGGSVIWSTRGRSFGGTVGSTAYGDSWIAPTQSLDLRAYYRPLEHFELYISAKNLTDSWWREYSGIDQHRPLTAIRDGVTIQTGIEFHY